MHPVLFIVLVAVAVFILAKISLSQQRKRDEKSAQKAVDKNVEWQLEDRFHEITIETLARHSDVEKMARIASSRIEDYIYMAVHPKKLSQIFQKLGLFTAVRNNWGSKELQLAALIQQYVIRNLHAHDLRVYQTVVCEDKASGFEELNKSFITKVHDDMLVWSLM